MRFHRILLLRTIAALSVLLYMPCVFAQQNVRLQDRSAAGPSPNLSGIAHIALRVHNLDASIAFYEKLGFVRAFTLSRDSKVYEAFMKVNDRQFIELYPATHDQAQPEFLHVCFEGNHLQAVHDFYVAAGLTPTAVKTADAGNLLFTMSGPDTDTGAQNMEYTQYMAGSLHSKDFGLHLGFRRLADEIMQVTIAVKDVPGARAFYLDKAGFVAGQGEVVKLPGKPQQSLRIVSSAQFGLRASIVLKMQRQHDTEMALKKAGISYDKHDKKLTLLDPDGNENVLATVK